MINWSVAFLQEQGYHALPRTPVPSTANLHVVDVSLGFTVSFPSQCFAAIELVTQLAEITTHRYDVALT